MPTLDWIGKKAVINHHREVPYRLLRCDRRLSAGDPDAGNLLVQGDNLLALKALLPYYVGKVKCIYIDPPYNTGNEGWVYNDSVNSPDIRSWLGKTVGKEAEDLSRHDKWLCMMYPRLMLLKQFLSEEGSIWISIDDTEVSSLRYLLDEIFGKRNFIACNVWQKRYSRENRGAAALSVAQLPNKFVRVEGFSTHVSAAVLIFALVLLVSVFLLDYFYYYRLLIGAVEIGQQIETANPHIFGITNYLSEKVSRRRAELVIWGFYGIPALTGLIFLAYVLWLHQPEAITL
jgi:hypothetical protein